MSKIVTPTGAILDPNGGWAKSATDYAIGKGFHSIRVFLATVPDGSQEYVIYEGSVPIKSSESFETICTYIDMMAISRDFG